MKNKKILMAVGKSGGHIYPALAVAKALESESPHVEIHFVHSGSELAVKILSQSQYPVHKISIGGLASGQKTFTKIKTLLQLPLSFLKAFSLIWKYRFVAVLGTGGSVTGPVLLAARLRSCYTCIWEGNSTSGIANKYLSPFVHNIFVNFKEVFGFSQKKQIYCGYPVRKNIENQIANSGQKLNTKIFKVLILGGSQGSVLLNQVVCEAVQQEQWRKNIFIYHQTGVKHYPSIKKQYQNLKGIEAFDFNPNIYDYYKDSDLIFSRAGSGAIFEISACKKALVLVPLSHSAGGHQLKNASYLYDKQAVELIKEKDLNATSFQNMIVSLKDKQDHRQILASNLFQHYKKEGAKTIALHILSKI